MVILVFVLQKVSTLDEYYFCDSDIAALRRATHHLDEAWGQHEASLRTMLLSDPGLSEPLQHILDARFELLGLVDRVKEFR